MVLAAFMKTDKDALLCDLAQTYHIYDFKSVPLSTLATLAVGLNDDSRIKLKMVGAKVSTSLLLLATCVDRLTLLVWAKTKDAQKGRNRPKSVVDALMGTDKAKSSESFNTAEEFERRRNELVERSRKDG